MVFNVNDFASAGDLKDFVVAQAIVTANIQAIVHDASNGRWYLFYWV
jgi:hypothetical protein